MPKKKLEEQLNHLKTEIERLDVKDEETRARLLALTVSIQQKLDSPEDEDHHHATLSTLETNMLGFKVKHPQVSAILDRVINILKNMGI